MISSRCSAHWTIAQSQTSRKNAAASGFASNQAARDTNALLSTPWWPGTMFSP